MIWLRVDISGTENGEATKNINETMVVLKEKSTTA